ncbi:uncharacterized protein LOC135494118 isoform X3 [Lineus longissimus]|uniref:uncharacterized protein LOC135494118 isoform X3 n=1 Tax=Lineus longissimus TaxID=88925 RepID=UPI00315D997A
MWYELFSAVLGLILYLVFMFLCKGAGGENNLEVAARVLNPPGGRVSINLFGGGEPAPQPSHVRCNPKNSTSKENFFDQPGTSNKPLTPPRAAQQPRQSDPIRPQQPETRPSQSQQSVKKNISSTGTSNGQLTAGYLEPTISFLTKSRYVNHVHTPRENGTAPSEKEHSRPATSSGSCFCTSNQTCRACSQQQQGGQKAHSNNKAESSQQQGGQKAVKMVNEAGQSSGDNKAVQRRTGRGRRPQQAWGAPVMTPTKSYYNPQIANMDPMTAHPIRVIDREKLKSSAENRDPILGHGDFGEELDLLSTGIRRPKTPDSDTTRVRDPILGLGDLGEELDTLQRSPRVPKRPATPPNKVVRNPVLGEGDLGSEYDPVWKNAYSPGARKHHQAPVRDPIKGSGNIEQYDPVRKGPALKWSQSLRSPTPKLNSKADRRDPILGKELAQQKARPMYRLHNVEKEAATRNPISGQGDFHEDDKKRTMRRPKTPTKKMDNEEYALLDPIGHRGDNDRPLYVGSGPHTPRDRARTPTRMTTSAYRNCIVGEGALGPESTFNRPRRSKSCPRRVRETINRNPITGRNRDGTETENSQNTPPLGTATQRRHEYKRADSNPVTGTGQDLKSWDIQRNATPRTPRPHSVLSVYNPITPPSGVNGRAEVYRRIRRGSLTPPESGNPLTGDNCKCFDISLEQRSRMPSSAKNQVSNNSPFVRENHNNYNGYSGNQNDSSFTAM